MQVSFRTWNSKTECTSRPRVHALYTGKFQVLELWRGWEKHGLVPGPRTHIRSWILVGQKLGPGANLEVQ